MAGYRPWLKRWTTNRGQATLDVGELLSTHSNVCGPGNRGVCTRQVQSLLFTQLVQVVAQKKFMLSLFLP